MTEWLLVIGLVVASIVWIFIGLRAEIRAAGVCKNCWLYKVNSPRRSLADKTKPQKA
jgi:hypothetical protein